MQSFEDSRDALQAMGLAGLAVTTEQAVALTAAAALAGASVPVYVRTAVWERVARDGAAAAMAEPPGGMAAESVAAAGAVFSAVVEAGSEEPDRWRWELPHREDMPACARALIAAMLSDRVPPQVLDTFLVLASELATNAVRHGGAGPIVLWLVLEPGEVVCGVSDTNTLRPRQPPTGRDDGGRDDGGRGLALVGALSDGCGWYLTLTGKTVWFTQQRAIPCPQAGTADGGRERFPAVQGRPHRLLALAGDR
ncbi:ATP-binding protein [Actinomadura rupiterrae]|uniref:ATP-binding protein n=1 Tax=Actinomadura rupiterrae TaxID=559627 RepID=UPI0020A32376|nr:ATP-binding protein [Actinomadura rupiterrae]MCP2337390.1 anti-sigma regulatory factor (Ser/Thr protein kinase) [Actinomadura rupiterrae]